MVGIKHHTPAGGRGIKIAKSSYNEEHDPGAIADVLTDHDLAAHTSLGLAVENSANATTLDGLDSTAFVKVSDHTKAAHDALGIVPASHGNEAHTSTFITAADLPSSSSGARGQDGVGLVNGIATLWNPSNGDVPDGFQTVDNLGNFLVIEYIGGEQQNMNITHSIKIDGTTDLTTTVTDCNDITVFTYASTTSITGAIVNSSEKSTKFTFANASGSPIDIYLLAFNPEDNSTVVNIATSAPATGSIAITVTLPKPCRIECGYND